jgi:hypothetical protein
MFTAKVGGRILMSHLFVRSVLILSGFMLATSTGCRTASKPFSGSVWAPADATRVASASPVAQPSSQDLSSNSNSETADARSKLGAGVNEQQSEKDPLSGFYPKDDTSDLTTSTGPSSGNGTSQSIPRTGSFSSSSSRGCTSGCCPH